MNSHTRNLIPPGLTYLADNIITRQNILGVSAEAGSRWAGDLALPKSADTIFFAGCGYQYTSQLESLMSLVRTLDKSVIGAELPMRVAGLFRKLGADPAGVYRRLASRSRDADTRPLRDAVAVLRRLGLEFGYLAEAEPCCGASLYFTGLRREFSRNARQSYETLKSLGVRRIIGIVPSCTYALRDLFPRFIDGYDLEVRHFVEVVAEYSASMELRFPREVRVAYHDPCQLGRFLGLIDEPRKILTAIKGITLVDTLWTSGQWATCCGGGGGFEAVFPALSQILSVNRARELAETGAEILVTQCPGCIMQLEAGLKEAGFDGIEVLDLAQMVAMALEG